MRFPQFLTLTSLGLINSLLEVDTEKRLQTYLNVESHAFFQGLKFSTLFDQPAPKMASPLPVWNENEDSNNNGSGTTTPTNLSHSSNAIPNPTSTPNAATLALPRTEELKSSGNLPRSGSSNALNVSQAHPTTGLSQSTRSSLIVSMANLPQADSSDFAPLCGPDEVVLRSGSFLKKNAFSKKPMFLVLTSKQRILFVKSDKTTIKKAIPITTEVRIFYKDESHFSIILPPKGKTTTLEDPTKHAAMWVDYLTDHQIKNAVNDTSGSNFLSQSQSKYLSSSSRRSSMAVKDSKDEKK